MRVMVVASGPTSDIRARRHAESGRPIGGFFCPWRSPGAAAASTAWGSPTGPRQARGRCPARTGSRTGRVSQGVRRGSRRVRARAGRAERRAPSRARLVMPTTSDAGAPFSGAPAFAAYRVRIEPTERPGWPPDVHHAIDRHHASRRRARGAACRADPPRGHRAGDRWQRPELVSTGLRDGGEPGVLHDRRSRGLPHRRHPDATGAHAVALGRDAGRHAADPALRLRLDRAAGGDRLHDLLRGRPGRGWDLAQRRHGGGHRAGRQRAERVRPDGGREPAVLPQPGPRDARRRAVDQRRDRRRHEALQGHPARRGVVETGAPHGPRQRVVLGRRRRHPRAGAVAQRRHHGGYADRRRHALVRRRADRRADGDGRLPVLRRDDGDLRARAVAHRRHDDVAGRRHLSAVGQLLAGAAHGGGLDALLRRLRRCRPGAVEDRRHGGDDLPSRRHPPGLGELQSEWSDQAVQLPVLRRRRRRARPRALAQRRHDRRHAAGRRHRAGIRWLEPVPAVGDADVDDVRRDRNRRPPRSLRDVPGAARRELDVRYAAALGRRIVARRRAVRWQGSRWRGRALAQQRHDLVDLRASRSRAAGPDRELRPVGVRRARHERPVRGDIAVLGPRAVDLRRHRRGDDGPDRRAARP